MSISKIKISNRDIRLLMLLGAMLLVFASYRFIYLKNEEQTSEIQEEIGRLEAIESELLSKKVKLEETKVMNETMRNEINTIADRFGTGASYDKTILFIKNLEQESGIDISVIGFSNPEFIYKDTGGQENVNEETIDAETEQMNLVAGEQSASLDNVSESLANENTIIGYNSIVSIDFKVNYEGLKKCIDFINKHEERKNIREIDLAYDLQTGNLNGTMKINMFHLLGFQKEIEETEIAGVNIGTENIFDTIEMPASMKN